MFRETEAYSVLIMQSSARVFPFLSSTAKVNDCDVISDIEHP